MVGDVEIHADGPDVTKRDLTRLLSRATMIAAALATIPAADSDTPTAEPRDLDADTTISSGETPMFGFTRWLEGDPEIPDEEAP